MPWVPLQRKLMTDRIHLMSNVFLPLKRLHSIRRLEFTEIMF